MTRGRTFLLMLFALVLSGAGAGLRAEIQFDVFLGYGESQTGVTRESNWFPVGFEIFNDGPAFNAVVELDSDGGGRSNTRTVALELPTNTRKRFFIPVFGTGGRYTRWNARLKDERGKVVAEHEGLQARGDAGWRAQLLGGVSRTFPGTPRLPEVDAKLKDRQPLVARMLPAVFPDTPIALAGLDAIYLHSDKALDLSPAQVEALTSWTLGGGKLIVAVGQLTDVTGTPWLSSMLPMELEGVATLTTRDRFQSWMLETESDAGVTRARAGSDNPREKLKAEARFEGKEYVIATGRARGGRTLFEVDGHPLVVRALHGRGSVTVLNFDPEREPFRTWALRPWFWARIMQLPDALFATKENQYAGGNSIDGIFGGIVDSKQIRKLPVHWLLLLLVFYLLVIGPFDQYFLKRINRQMLTWITFPSYVVLFSVLIYWIGFMLRAGETEWNEFHVVDVFSQEETVRMRGRTYASIYSPRNASFPLASRQPFATLRGEFTGSHMGGQETSRAVVGHSGNGFEAEVFVPVWTSQLYVSDWWQNAERPVDLEVRRRAGKIVGSIRNNTPRRLTEARLVVGKRVHQLGELPPGESVTIDVTVGGGYPLRDFVLEQGNMFTHVVQSRQRAFGRSRPTRFQSDALAAMAAGFTSVLAANVAEHERYQKTFVASAHFDLGDLAERGDAIVLAYDSGNSFTAPLNQFSARRGTRNTLLRITAPVE